MPFRISEELTDEKLLPVIHFFNAIPNRKFVEVIKSLSNGVGYGLEYCHCNFPEDLDPWEESFEGIQFVNSALDLEVIIDHNTTLEYLLLSSKSYLKEFPEQRDILHQIILEFSQKYGLQFDEI